MPRKGGLVPGKDGGAHADPHVHVIIKQETPILDSFVVESQFHNTKKHENTLSSIQDGDPTVVSPKIEPMFLSSEPLPGISEVVESCMETDHDSSVVDLANFDSSANGAGDWFDTKTKTQNIDFDISSSPTGGDLISSRKDIPDEIGDIFDSHAINVSLLNVTSPSMEIDTIARRASHSGITTVVHSTDICTTPSRSHSQSAFDDRHISSLSSQDRACLEELERGSQLSQEEKELIEDHKKELGGLQDFDFHLKLESDRTGSLITPSDLDGIPDQGLDFVEAIETQEVSVKPDLDTFVVDAVQSLADYNIHDLGTTLSSLPSSALGSDNSTPAGSPIKNATSLATVSISTDKNTNVTQILVQTSQGQQVININTADLTQACSAAQNMASSLQPASMQAGAGSEQTLQGLPASEAVLKDGLLLIPVNQGVSGGEGNESSSSQRADDYFPRDDSEDQGDEDELPKDGGKVWLCSEPGCKSVFKKPSKLKIHLMRHTGERPFKCTHPGCDWAFVTGYKLKRHMESHEGSKDFVCDIDGCDKKFTTIYNLNTHKKLHERLCTELCPHEGCEETFPTKRKLDIHMKKHGFEKKYRCPKEGCDKTFYSPNSMGSHARVHQHEHNLVCEDCGKKFDKLCRLKQHVRTHTGEKPYPCTFEGCGWAFANASKLKRHIRKHTGERHYRCPHEGCGKAFMRSEHLRGHVITHGGNRPFICPVEGCDARFTAKSSLYVHMKKHEGTGEKITYHCPMEMCEKKYTSKASLRNHISKHFTNVPDDSNIWPMIPMSEELQEKVAETLEQAEVAAATESVAAAAITNVYSSISSGQIINPTEYIQTTTPTTQPSTPVTESVLHVPPDIVSQHVGSNVVTQLIVSNDVNPLFEQELSTTATSSVEVTTEVPPEVVSPEITLPAEPMYTLPKSESAELGSARTDFSNNTVLSDLAKKRRLLMKEAGGTLGVISLQEMKSKDFNASSFVMSPTTATSSSHSTSRAFSPSDLLSSQALTFRDPETGVTYVQTQLLQDDPPHPELYGSDIHMDTNDESPLTADLAVSSTINLQDLE